jgi:hypothetical protein
MKRPGFGWILASKGDVLNKHRHEDPQTISEVDLEAMVKSDVLEAYGREGFRPCQLDSNSLQT